MTQPARAQRLYAAARRAVASAPERWEEYFDLMRRAAALGHVPAQAHLGEWYLEGFRDRRGRSILPRSRSRGVALLRAAAEAGDTDALARLGLCYHDGEGVRRSREQALVFYRRAARRGHKWAAFNASIVCRDRGDRRGQLRWLERAADLGDTDALVERARLTLTGRSTRRARADAIIATQRLARSKDHTRGEAMLLLADAFGRGLGVPVSRTRERSWLIKAQSAGEQCAVDRLAELAKARSSGAAAGDQPRWRGASACRSVKA